MLFGKVNARKGRIQSVRLIALPLVIALISTISAFTSSKGSIIILENPKGTGFTMDFKEWSSKGKCGLSLKKGDVLQFEVARENGEIALSVCGKNGSEPYTGNNLQSGMFTVTVSETDKYDIRITGKNATGKVTVNKRQSLQLK